MKKKLSLVASCLTFFCLALAGHSAVAQKVIDEVVWLVGDEPILRSDIEYQKLRLLSQGYPLGADADCVIPEQLAVQMLFLNQAKIDSIQVDESMINRYVESNLKNMIAEVGSKEKLEEYFNKPLNQIREDQRLQTKNGEIVRAMQQKIVSSIQVNPSEIRSFYASMPTDSLPYVPTQLEVQIIVRKPVIPFTEIDRIKEQLRGYAEQVNKGDISFSTLARLYSQDNRTSANGGEYGFVARTSLEPEFARIVFDLTDNKHLSPIIQTEEGYHLVQLIEKKGELVNFRHILLRPTVATEALQKEITMLDSIGLQIANGKISFEEAVARYSQEEETRNSQGLLVNTNMQSDYAGGSYFSLEELPQDISREVSDLGVGEVTKAFIQNNKKGNKEIVLVKVKNRREAHRATLTEDFQTIKDLALEKKRSRLLDEWIESQQKKTFIQINKSYKQCNFKYPHWVHENK